MIWADKTGTMTEKQMAANRVLIDQRTVTEMSNGRSATGQFVESGRVLSPGDDSELRFFLTVSALVNDASVHVLGPDRLELHGDPTETALLVAALKAELY